ncbi:50S ribosomal protein L2 [Candidatus Woesebacteria bacterium RIFCSPHIGHO2_02_FULL_38_9]|uniref:50S ribosomal protein L2 n=1 Tax=Candidatus Woesebacteria bacterium RIFCSPHIGHO2_01_FULL_39_28 TaxID=1802496 RepID=A0A1F7YA47_9BACT|nr:MAG: 50S ribosomal protein L2 [Candidatus Woesebacteria bacterium RIFCSPHIGHO2_01_FULL_39_28]OGM32247.1 MAG: 50S ribosomal protein L2 [Candidatus Woesebacteria bacterium RIFCSPHIGHO2_02_FULL_38_9]OGM58471.1 MAG: 50S ribosomal protein L2 [Candidatus Woesebacteria bacterium RIFCSPLOWO2_01_FULL_38_20]
MKNLMAILSKKSGRSKGRVTVRHQGGRQKRYLRMIDFKRDKKDISARVEAIEYDPNRTASIARVLYSDGERRYTLAPFGLKEGDFVTSGKNSALTSGNSLPLSLIPVGTVIHNIEINPGKGGQLVKGAGSAATIFGREEGAILIKLPSGQIKRFKPDCYATIGQVGNPEKKSKNVKKAGIKRRLGIRPTVRGTAQNPRSHPHGGGEGRSGVGMKYPKTPWGKPAVGKTRKKRKYSDKLIMKGIRL